MAIDHPAKRKRGRPVSSQSAKNNTEQELASLDSGGSSSSCQTDKDDDFVPMDDELAIVHAHQQVAVHYGDTDHYDKEVVPFARNRRPFGSQASKNKTEQNMALVKHMMPFGDIGSSERDENDNFRPTEELAIIVADDDAEDVIPLEIVRPRRNKKRKCHSVRQHVNTGIHTTKGNKVLKSNSTVNGNHGSAMDRAKEFQDKLPIAYPSFVKLMRPSHCVFCYWLGIPADFYQNHLPKLKTEFMLEDENGQNHQTTYIGDRKGPGLSGGWGRFAIYHNIKVDDVVIFQLVESRKFKVYIVRKNEFDTTDVAFSHMNSEVCKEGKPSVKSEEGSSDDVDSNEDAQATTYDRNVQHNEESCVAGEDTTDGNSIADSDICFDRVTSFSNFSIVVDSLAIDCKFQEHQRRAYYELCYSQKSYLHKHLLRHLNHTLVAGVIAGTINIAECIRACAEEGSSREDFMIWKKTLESFELLGMDVAFMLKRVNDILGLPIRSIDLPKCQNYKDLKLEQARAGEKVKALELQLSTVQESLRKMDLELWEMESSAKKSDLTLQELAKAPW